MNYLAGGAGLIHYSRGHIKVLDRPKLEQRVCERYMPFGLQIPADAASAAPTMACASVWMRRK